MTSPVVTLRYAFPDDANALARLAAIDSAEVPAEPLLLAEVEGELRAALSLRDGEAVADPFHPTEALIELLRARSEQLVPSAGRSRRVHRLARRARLRPAGPRPGG
jgi:hypothetical protein